MLGFAAGALFSWQSAGERKSRRLWLLLLAVCLAASTALHYYSIFLLVPLGLGELARWHARKKFDFGVLLAMLPGLLVLALHYPLIAAGKKYLTHFWVPGVASWSRIQEFYLQFALIPAARFWWVGLRLVCVARPRAEFCRLRAARGGMGGDRSTRLSPGLVLVISRLTTHVFLPRYTLWAAIGISIACAALLCRAARRNDCGTLIVLILASGLVGQECFSLRKQPTLRQAEAVRLQLKTVPAGSDPIVVEYDHAFMELSYYAEPQLRWRLYYLLDQDLNCSIRVPTGLLPDVGEREADQTAQHRTQRLPADESEAFAGGERQRLFARIFESTGVLCLSGGDAAERMLYRIERRHNEQACAQNQPAR